MKRRMIWVGGLPAALVTLVLRNSGRLGLAALGAELALIPVSYTHLDVYKRQVLGSYYNTSLLDGNWWLGADSTLRLTGTMNTGEPLTLSLIHI